jgi:hypothetical protein
MPDSFNPLPVREQNELLMAVRDIMNNGGRIPQDVSNELIMAAILELNGCVKSNATLSLRNAIALRWVGAGVLVLSAIVIGLHAGSSEFIATIAGIFVP